MRIVIKIEKRKVIRGERENLEAKKGERSDVLRTCGPPAPRSILHVSKSRYDRSTGTLRATTNSRTSDGRSSAALKNFHPRETKETLLFYDGTFIPKCRRLWIHSGLFFNFPPLPPSFSILQFASVRKEGHRSRWNIKQGSYYF